MFKQPEYKRQLMEIESQSSVACSLSDTPADMLMLSTFQTWTFHLDCCHGDNLRAKTPYSCKMRVYHSFCTVSWQLVTFHSPSSVQKVSGLICLITSPLLLLTLHPQLVTQWFLHSHAEMLSGVFPKSSIRRFPERQCILGELFFQ